MGRFGRVLSLVAIACGLLAAYNVFADDPNLESVARQKSCPGNDSTNQASCRSRLLRLRRSPITQAYVFTAGGTEVQVDCTRAYLLLGGYNCARLPRVQLRAPGAGTRGR